MYDSSNNAVFANNVTNCYNGIWISKCFRSTFSGNSITGSEYGVGDDSASNNTFHHNNFVNNSHGAYVQTPEYMNNWDDGSEGNYWSNYVSGISQRY